MPEMLGSLAMLAGAFAIALLAWDFGRRWLDYRRNLLLERSRLDRFEAELAEHKTIHKRAIENLVTEMREATGAATTKSSLALERANQANRRFGR